MRASAVDLSPGGARCWTAGNGRSSGGDPNGGGSSDLRAAGRLREDVLVAVRVRRGLKVGGRGDVRRVPTVGADPRGVAARVGVAAGGGAGQPGGGPGGPVPQVHVAGPVEVGRVEIAGVRVEEHAPAVVADAGVHAFPVALLAGVADADQLD